MTTLPPTVSWSGDAIAAIDQTALPRELRLLEIRDVPELVRAIQTLAIRGAPALGVAGAFGVVLALRTASDLAGALESIRHARPTAVNLAWGVDRAAARIPEGVTAVLEEALAIAREDVAACKAIGERGADLIEELHAGPIRLLTHCNAGALACVEWGTALGIVRSLHLRQLVQEVLVDETRPLLQGARLTAFELRLENIPHRVIVDAAAPAAISRGLVDAVVVGADRIAANGDVVNKIGTYAVALAAFQAGIPFLVAAPESTLDPDTPSGADVPIEERPAEEVLGISGIDSDAGNWAFDVTPASLVTAIVTESRVLR